MAKIGRPGIPSAQRELAWALRRQGKDLTAIARAVGSSRGAIYSLFLPFGGYSQAPQQRRATALTAAEREEISRGLAAQESYRAIARRLGRAPSTILREVARNRGPQRYRAEEAEDRAWRSARRPRPCWLAQQPRLCAYVAAHLAQDWSPEQIAGTLKRTFPTEPTMQVSHETIYKSLFVRARGVLGRHLTRHLRSRRALRGSRHRTRRGLGRGQIPDPVSIHDRPEEVADRVVPGHWEGDLLQGAGHTQIATVVERATRFTVLVQLERKDMATVTAGLTRELMKLPEAVRRSLTWDRGPELAGHAQVTAYTGLQVYFADPKSPWQRGTNENTNRLLRQYFPKGTSLADVTQDDLDAVAARLNARPRKTLHFETPAERMANLLR